MGMRKGVVLPQVGHHGVSKIRYPVVVRPSHSHTCPEIVWLTLQIIRPFSPETFKHCEDHGVAVMLNKVAAGPSQFLRFFSSEGSERDYSWVKSDPVSVVLSPTVAAVGKPRSYLHRAFLNLECKLTSCDLKYKRSLLPQIRVSEMPSS